MSRTYNLKNIRALLINGFTSAELRDLCFYNPEFRFVYDHLDQHTPKIDIVDLLIEYAERRALMGALLRLVQELNPAKYEEYKASLRIPSSPSIFDTSPTHSRPTMIPAKPNQIPAQWNFTGVFIPVVIFFIIGLIGITLLRLDIISRTGQPIAQNILISIPPPSPTAQTVTPTVTGLVELPTEGFTPAPTQEVSTSTPTNTVSATPTATNTAPPTSTPTATSTPAPEARSTTSPISVPVAGIFEDFERGNSCVWKRGNQPYGDLSCARDQIYEGNFAGKLSYNFAAVADNFVVLQKNYALAGTPTTISLVVYGDNSGHYLNSWIKDAEGEIWQLSFGQIRHTGWQVLNAEIKISTAWPYGLISGNGNGQIDYPISFNALVLDGVPDFSASSGQIYLDNLNSEEKAITVQPTPSIEPLPTPSTTPVVETPPDPPTATTFTGRIAFPMDDGADHYDIWIKPLPTGQPFRVIQGARQPNFAKGDGRLLVNGESSPSGYNLILLNSELKPVNLVSDFIEDEHPYWEPGGNRMVYANPIMISAGTHLFVQCSAIKRPQAEEGEQCRDIKTYGVLKSSIGGDVLGEYPVWTDQDWIVFRGLGSMARPGINKIVSWATHRDLPEYEQQQPFFIPNTSPNSRPADAAAGRVFFFADDIDGNWEVYAINLDGSNRVNLSNSPTSRDGLPTISPDGQWVAFASDREGKWSVWVVPFNGGSAQKLFDFPKPNPWRSGSRNDWVIERISWGP